MLLVYLKFSVVSVGEKHDLYQQKYTTTRTKLAQIKQRRSQDKVVIFIDDTETNSANHSQHVNTYSKPAITTPDYGNKCV